MIKRMLSIVSMMFAAAFMFVSPASAMDCETLETPMVSSINTGVDPGIPIDDDNGLPFKMVALTYLDEPWTHSRFDFVPDQRNIAINHFVKGGGVTYTHGGNPL